jgi:hypothetical protein
MAALGAAMLLAVLADTLVVRSHIVVQVACQATAFLATVSVLLGPLVKSARGALQIVKQAQRSKQDLLEQKKKERAGTEGVPNGNPRERPNCQGRTRRR